MKLSKIGNRKMTLDKGNKIDRGYSTVIDDDGVNYREIAEIMTVIGFPMNHSSARNNVLRMMKKFCLEIRDEWAIELSDDSIIEIAKTPDFQSGIADLLHMVEAQRRRIR